MTFIDFCAGIGGFRLGLELAGYKCIGFCEKDKFAVKSYRAMFDTNGEWYRDDVTTIKSEEVPFADVWCFGFPCQDISISGKQRGIVGNRSGIYFSIIKLVKGKEEKDKPTYLFIENVKNLLSINSGFDYATVLSELDEAGYDARWSLQNSKAHNLPQNRERVFITANLRSRGRREILPVGGANENTLKQIIGGMQGYRVYDAKGISTAIVGNAGGVGAKTGLYLIDQSLKNPKITETARCVTSRYTAGIVNRSASNSGVLEVYPILTPDRLEKRQNGRRIKSSNEPMFTITSSEVHGIIINDRRKDDVRASEICPTLLSRDYKSPKKVIVDRMFNPYNKSEITDIAPTQTGTCGSKTSSSAVLIQKNCRIRRLTPKETFRLQGFPDALFEKARAVNSDAQLYKQAGNAVSVNVAYAIAKSVFDCEEILAKNKCIMNK